MTDRPITSVLRVSTKTGTGVASSLRLSALWAVLWLAESLAFVGFAESGVGQGNSQGATGEGSALY